MFFPSSKGIIDLLNDAPLYQDVIFPSTKGVVILSSVGSEVELVEAHPSNGEYNISPGTPISFIITNASSLLTTDISVTVNSIFAIESGVFSNGFSGTISYDNILEAIKVTILPKDEFPNFVGWTVTLQYPDPYQTEFSYTFKTRIAQHNIKTSSTVKKLYANKAYVFAATEEGLDVIDIRTKQNVAYIMRPGGFTAVWCKQTYDSTDCLYLGTETSGVFKILMSDILKGGDISQYLTSKFTTGTTPSLPSNYIIHIHGFQNKLVILTPNNIVYIDSETTKYSASLPATISSGFVFLTTTNDLYYTSTNGLHAKYVVSDNWVSPDYTYSTTSSLPIGSNTITGLFIAPVTSGNSTYYNNTLFIATTNGVFVVNEDKGNEVNGTVKSFGATGKTHNLLQSDVCTTLWADAIEAVEEGRFYLGDDSGTFYIINNKQNTIIFQYDIDSGNFGEFLNTSTLRSIISLF